MLFKVRPVKKQYARNSMAIPSRWLAVQTIYK